MEQNIVPNGRTSESYGRNYYLNIKFQRIDPPKANEKDYEQKSKSSVVAEFNRAQQALGKEVISAFTFREWLTKYFEKDRGIKIGICPHMTDYCDTCKQLKVEIQRSCTIIRRMRESGNANPSTLRDCEQELLSFESNVLQHKTDAQSARSHYKEAIEKCKTSWKRIEELSNKSELVPEEQEELDRLQHCFSLVLSADFQQSKLVPHWGKTQQPGQTYYLIKFSNNIFGITDHRNGNNSVFLFGEELSPKNTDHTISFLHQYISNTKAVYPWMSRVHLFLDNAGNTNKNKYFVSWCFEAVEKRLANYIRISFMVPGHTKFAPDRLFSSIAHTYNRSDVFNISELQAICANHATTTISSGSDIYHWISYLSTKYSDVPGIRKLHDFVIVRSPSGTMMKVKEKLYAGEFSKSPMSQLGEYSEDSSLRPYTPKAIGPEKLQHITLMCTRYISSSRWPKCIPRQRFTANTPSSHNTGTSNTASTATTSTRKHSMLQQINDVK